MNLVLLNQHQTDGNACAAAMRTLTCRAKYDRQPIITQDGGTVALDWFQPRGPDKIPSDAPIVLILHGLTGDCHACGVQHSFFLQPHALQSRRCLQVQLNFAFSYQARAAQVLHACFLGIFVLAISVAHNT